MYSLVKKTPSTTDGRQIILPSTMGDAQEVQFPGSGDDITNGARLGGTDFKCTLTSTGSTTVEFQFMEWISIGGGSARYTGALIGDYLHYDAYAPATAGTSNPGAGAYDKYNLGGPCNLYIPNGTTTGDWDLNLTEKHNANVVFTKVVPVPASNKDGWFDWDSDTYAVTLNANQKGGYNLFDFEIHLTRIIHKGWMLGDGMDEYIVPSGYGSKVLLPHYTHKVTVNKASDTGTLDVVWTVFVGRKTTTP